MMFEAVEPRRMLSGNVSVRIDSDTFRLTGDGADNAVAVVRSRASGEFILTGLNGTTIDGRATRTYTGPTKFFASFGNGSDTLILDRFASGANLSINLGGGNDAVYVKRGLLGAADLYGDAGNDTLDITNTTLSKRLRLFPGEQDDVTAMRAVRADRGLEVTDTAGKSVVAMKQASASETSWVSGSSRPDDLTIIDSDFNAFSAKLKSGGDRVYIRGTTFAQPSPIDGGAGTNDIDREVRLGYDFDAGAHEWLAGLSGVANYDPQNPPTRSQLFADNQGEYGIRSLPAETGLSEQAYYVKGDGYLYLQKQIGAEQGLVPGVTYDVTVSVDFATAHNQSGASAAGGPVLVHAGAVNRRPKITRVEDGLAFINLTLASDALPRPDADVEFIGYANKDVNPVTPTTGQGGYRVVRREQEVFAVQSNASGDAWLFVGQTGTTDSAGSPPDLVDVYFAKISFTLTPSQS